jgi:hypothetical protein
MLVIQRSGYFISTVVDSTRCNLIEGEIPPQHPFEGIDVADIFIASRGDTYGPPFRADTDHETYALTDDEVTRWRIVFTWNSHRTEPLSIERIPKEADVTAQEDVARGWTA